MNVLIRPTSDTNTREYHLSDDITDEPYTQVLDSEMNGNARSQFSGQVKDWLKALRDLADVNGIEKLVFRPRSIKVTKNAAVSWNTLEPNIISALETTFQHVEVQFYNVSRMRAHA